MAPDGGGWSTPRPGRFTRGNNPVGGWWVPGPVWTGEECLAPRRGFDGHCTTSRQVAVSIQDGVIGVFFSDSPSGHTMAVVESIQPLTKMSTGNISWRYRRSVRRADSLNTLGADCLEGWEPERLGTLRTCIASTVIAFTGIRSRAIQPGTSSYTGFPTPAHF